LFRRRRRHLRQTSKRSRSTQLRSGFPLTIQMAATALIEGDAPFRLSGHSRQRFIYGQRATVRTYVKAGFIVISSLSSDSFAIRSGYAPAPRAKAAT
jgi:hypothetical protein